MERQQRMSGMARLLDPSRVRLDLPADSREGAADAAMALLRDDPRLASWEEFRRSVGGKQIVDLEGSDGAVLLAHGRDPAVREMTMAAARFSAPSCPRLVFVFAIPSAMAGEYLRAVGALARVCRQQDKLAVLLSAPDPETFAGTLEEWMA
jgi:mannitol/fructose-specific phosphotransferase system IIA component (Ntr-type)